MRVLACGSLSITILFDSLLASAGLIRYYSISNFIIYDFQFSHWSSQVLITCKLAVILNIDGARFTE